MPNDKDKNDKDGSKKDSEIQKPSSPKKTITPIAPTATQPTATANPTASAAQSEPIKTLRPPPLSSTTPPTLSSPEESNKTGMDSRNQHRTRTMLHSSFSSALSSPSTPAAIKMPPLIKAEDITKEKQLGKGSYGTAYQATYKAQKVAMKELDLSADPVKQFQFELQRLGQEAKTLRDNDRSKEADQIELARKKLMELSDLEKMIKTNPKGASEAMLKMAEFLKTPGNNSESVQTELKQTAGELETRAKQIQKGLTEFEEEVRLMASIGSPFTVGALAYSKNPPFVVMDLMPNSLAQLLKKQTEESSHSVATNSKINDDKLRLVQELAQGLRSIHRARILHRDLKADNILIDRDNHIRIADFGLSQAKEKKTYSVKKNSALVLDTEIRVGTLEYLAPELYRELEGLPPFFSYASDVYSFGMVVWEIYSGITPYSDFVGDREDHILAEKAFKKNLPCKTKKLSR